MHGRDSNERSRKRLSPSSAAYDTGGKAKKDEGSELSDINRLLLHRLHKASRVIEYRFTKSSEGNVTARQAILLMAIAAVPQASQAGLCRETGVDRSTIADVLRRLEALGLLRRRKAKTDSRTNEVRLTERGRSMAIVASRQLKAVEDTVLRGLSTTRRRELYLALATIG